MNFASDFGPPAQSNMSESTSSSIPVYHDEYNDPNAEVIFRDNRGKLYRISGYFLARHRDMIGSATASDEPIETELNQDRLSALLDAFHIPALRFEYQDNFAPCVFDKDFHDYVSLYKFAAKFDCWIIKPFLAELTCETKPEHNLIATLELASRLDDLPLAATAVDSMNWKAFQAFNISTMAAALRPEWQLPFLRCVLVDSPGEAACGPNAAGSAFAGNVTVRLQWRRSGMFEREVKKLMS